MRIRYRLVEAPDVAGGEGSRLSFSQTATTQPILLPLAGTFDVIPVEPLPPNTAVALRIVSVSFTAGPFLIEGSDEAGFISIATLNSGQPLSALLRLTITQQFTHEVFLVDLAGAGGPETYTMDFPPTFRKVVVSSNGEFHMFILDLVAAVESGVVS